MAAALPFIMPAIGGIFGGIGASRPKTSTSTQKSSSTQEGVLQGKQNKVNKILGQQLIDWLRLGPHVAQGDRDTMRGQINDQADAATNRVSSDLASRGMSNSGVKGRTFKDIQLARTKSMQTGEAGLQSQALQRFMQAMGLGMQYDTPRQFNTTSESSGTSTQPGQNPFSSIGSGLGDLSSLMFMKNMMGGGGGPFNSAGTGNSLGGGYAGCWIAMEIFGKNDWRVLIVRAFLVRKAGESLSWRALWALYLIFGRAVAAMVRHSSVLRRGFRLLFDQVVFST